ncbi:MAG: prepilin peptidase [Thomasclavelia sp.]|nr:prepilin peptidase [Thomasclavelia sp.]
MINIEIIGKIYSFIIGTCLASFINVVVYRIENHESFIKGRSHCNNCLKTIRWYDLIPILSFILLKGRCRYCKDKIPLRGFIIEIIGGLIGLICYLEYGIRINTLIVLILSMILLTISLIDIDTMEIPNGLIITMSICSIIYFIVNEMNIIDSIVGMLIISLPMFVLTIIIPDCFGGGDIKLMFVSGIMLGSINSLLATCIAIILAGIYSSYLMITKKVNMKSHIPFGPYLAFGIVLALMQGSNIITAYWNLLV